MKKTSVKIENDQKAGLYLHIPFCVRKCPYCDFYSIDDFSLENRFTDALETEIAILASEGVEFDTVYLGGGTPSSLGSENIGRILGSVMGKLRISTGAEITIEANPGTVDLDKLRDFKRYGINRINFGIQSFHDRELNQLGRIHSSKEGELALEWARTAGFTNVGFDLIYGLPGQTDASWAQNIERAIELNPEHLSCYMLTYEPGTSLDNRRLDGRVKPLDDEVMRMFFEMTMEQLEKSGYLQYEISNFARSKNLRSRHNLKYWSFAPYAGLGPSAHSFSGIERRWNYKNIFKYMESLMAGGSPVEEMELLSGEQQAIEAIYLGLRTRQGINTASFDRSFGTCFHDTFSDLIERLEKEGTLEVSKEHCRLTRTGMVFLDSITAMFVKHDF